MTVTLDNDFDKVVTKIRDQLQTLNPNKRFSKKGVLLFALGDSPNLKDIISTMPEHKFAFNKVPRGIRTR